MPAERSVQDADYKQAADTAEPDTAEPDTAEPDTAAAAVLQVFPAVLMKQCRSVILPVSAWGCCTGTEKQAFSLPSLLWEQDQNDLLSGSLLL